MCLQVVAKTVGEERNGSGNKIKKKVSFFVIDIVIIIIVFLIVKQLDSLLMCTSITHPNLKRKKILILSV